MTKKLLLPATLILQLVTYNCPAQQPGYEPHDTKTEKQYKWGIGVQVNTWDKSPPLANSGLGINYKFLDGGDRQNKTFAIGVIGYHFVKRNKYLRLKTGITINNIIEHRDIGGDSASGGYHTIDHLHMKQNVINFSPGVEWKINKDNIEFLVGSEITTLLYTGRKDESYHIDKDAMYDTTFYADEGTDFVPGGWAIGPGIFSGFNIFLFKNMSLGGECSLAFMYRKVGGEIKSEGKQTVPLVQNLTSGFHETIEDLAIPRFSASLTIAYSFQ